MAASALPNEGLHSSVCYLSVPPETSPYWIAKRLPGKDGGDRPHPLILIHGYRTLGKLSFSFRRKKPSFSFSLRAFHALKVRSTTA